MLALTFANPEDYELIRQDDLIDLTGFENMAPGRNLTMILHHADGTQDSIELSHTYNQAQIEWVQSGSALNKIRKGLGA